MSIGTMLFNPFTGKPRDPRDIASDPRGILVWDGEEPLRAATKPAQAEPMSDERIAKAYETEDVAPTDAPESIFEAGARWAVRAIKDGANG